MVFASVDDTHGLMLSVPGTIAFERPSREKVEGHSPERETCSYQGGNANMRPAHSIPPSWPPDRLHPRPAGP